MRTDVNFPQLAAAGLANRTLSESLDVLEQSRSLHYKLAFDELDDAASLKAAATEVRRHSVANLRFYLEQFERNVVAAGGHVHWARTAEEANRIVTDLCVAADAQLVTKSKSMVTEEIELVPALEAAGLEVIETDLGEYIIQLRNEPPSHITAPALHLNLQQVIDAFNSSHDVERDAPLENADQLLAEARAVLRDKFLRADVGITGANFLVAQSGGAVVVTNEGNADLTAIIPETHIVVTGIEKVVPTFEDVGTLLRVLPRAAVGQRLANYTSFFHGPERQQGDGARNFHVVLLDNGRSAMRKSELAEMLRCIRCGACMNHCPVYTAVGGHAYGSVYPGPMGSVLTPQFANLEKAFHLPNASTFCGRCAEVCPVGIPLPDLLRKLRGTAWRKQLGNSRERLGLRLWRVVNRYPRLYRFAQSLTAMGLQVLARLQSGQGYVRRVPMLGAGWSACRDLPAPQSSSFQRSVGKAQAWRR